MGKLELNKAPKPKTTKPESSALKSKQSPRKVVTSTSNLPKKRPVRSKNESRVLTEKGQSLLERLKLAFTSKTVHKPKKPSTRLTTSNVNQSSNNQQQAETRQDAIVPTNVPSNSKNRKFQYTEPKKYDREKTEVKEVEVIEEKNERVLLVRPKLETVSNLSEVGFFDKIGLVSYFNAKEKGKLEERIEREEYIRNTKSLQKVNSLKSFLLESAKRNLESRETPEIIIHVDPSLREELKMVIDSKLLSSYEINIIKQDEVLTKLRVEPIEISMKLKKIN